MVPFPQSAGDSFPAFYFSADGLSASPGTTNASWARCSRSPTMGCATAKEQESTCSVSGPGQHLLEAATNSGYLNYGLSAWLCLKTVTQTHQTQWKIEVPSTKPLSYTTFVLMPVRNKLVNSKGRAEKVLEELEALNNLYSADLHTGGAEQTAVFHQPTCVPWWPPATMRESSCQGSRAISQPWQTSCTSKEPSPQLDIDAE